MAKYVINIGNLSEEQLKAVKDKLNTEGQVQINPSSVEDVKPTDSTTKIVQHITQIGTSNNSFTKPISGLHIGDTNTNE